MSRYVAGRILQAIPTLLGVTVIVFLLLQLSGDPASILLPMDATDADRAAFRAAYGLDQPIPVQYVSYLGQLVQGDFGTSFAFQESALNVVLRRLPATLELALAATVLANLIAIPAGIIAALKRGTLFDRGLMALVLVGQSIPTFWLGMMLALVIAVQFKLVPVSGRGGFSHLILPAVTLAVWLIALLARVTRSEMLDVLNNDYVRTARAKGMSEKVVITSHALRNALPPIVTVIGLQFGGLLGGAVMTETVFAWPGVGTLILDSISKRDYPVVMTGILVVAGAFIVINLALDLLYGSLDPRIKKA
jgi:peptide/nickel transport system permease protein